MNALYGDRAARVLDETGREIGMLYLEDEILQSRRHQEWWRPWGAMKQEEAIHQHYWSPAGDYEDAIISGEALRHSVALWNSGKAEVTGTLYTVEWLDAKRSREVWSWLEARLNA